MIIESQNGNHLDCAIYIYICSAATAPKPSNSSAVNLGSTLASSRKPNFLASCCVLVSSALAVVADADQYVLVCNSPLDELDRSLPNKRSMLISERLQPCLKGDQALSLATQMQTVERAFIWRWLRVWPAIWQEPFLYPNLLSRLRAKTAQRSCSRKPVKASSARSWRLRSECSIGASNLKSETWKTLNHSASMKCLLLKFEVRNMEDSESFCVYEMPPPHKWLMIIGGNLQNLVNIWIAQCLLMTQFEKIKKGIPTQHFQSRL